ncbi:MAG: alpha/beta fold hydrolase [Candidatus Woesearchaeota archaeon]
MAEKNKKKTEQEVIEKAKKGFKISAILIPIVVALAFLILLFLGIQINFILNDELNIALEPRDSSFFTRKEAINVNFTIKNNNYFLCKSECEYYLTDLRDNKEISSEKFEIDHAETKTKQFKLSPPKRGSGQAIYSFQLKCKNIKTFLCRTDSQPRYKTSIISINYDLSEEEATLKSILESKTENWLNEMKNSLQILEQNKIIIERLQNKKELLEKNSLLEKALDKAIKEKNELLLLWRTEDYFELNKRFSDEKINDVKKIKDDLLVLQNESVIRILEINTQAQLFIDLLNESAKISNTANFYQQEANKNNSERLEKLDSAAKKVYDGFLALEKGQIASNVSENIDAIKLIVREFEAIIGDGFTLLVSGQSKLEQKQNISINKSAVFSCNDLKNITIEIDNYNYLAASMNSTDLINNSINKEFLIENCKSNETIILEAPDGINSLLSVNVSEIKMIITEIPAVEINLTTELDPNPPICCLFGECKSCCENECENKEEMFPVLFIHGHAFNEANTPEFSMNAFTKIQRKMQDDGFINAGELDVTLDPEEVPYGEWGRSGRPVTGRASYYYIRSYDLGVYTLVAQKSERIENYALRLKEIIDLLKHRTGTNKVNIVAHSMGGLVAREYLSLFGGNDVNKIILINTPNHGISENAAKKCKLFGSIKECEDMTQGSVFLKRLNAKKLPDVKLYVIRSIGCKMEGNKEGDGVVIGENAYLEEANNHVIEGKCTDAFNSNLHTNVLDIDLYPKTYEIIKEILIN